MKRILTIVGLAATVLVSHAQDKLYSDEFPLGDVTLLDGPLKHARDLNIVCWRPIARRLGWSQGRRPIPTGTGWTDTWAATISRRWP